MINKIGDSLVSHWLGDDWYGVTPKRIADGNAVQSSSCFPTRKSLLTVVILSGRWDMTREMTWAFGCINFRDYPEVC